LFCQPAAISSCKNNDTEIPPLARIVIRAKEREEKIKETICNKMSWQSPQTRANGGVNSLFYS